MTWWQIFFGSGLSGLGISLQREITIMGTNNIVFLENLEWFDDTGKELVHRLPQKGSGEIKYGAQLTIRESQAGVFFIKVRP